MIIIEGNWREDDVVYGGREGEKEGSLSIGEGPVVSQEEGCGEVVAVEEYFCELD